MTLDQSGAPCREKDIYGIGATAKTSYFMEDHQTNTAKKPVLDKKHWPFPKKSSNSIKYFTKTFRLKMRQPEVICYLWIPGFALFGERTEGLSTKSYDCCIFLPESWLRICFFFKVLQLSIFLLVLCYNQILIACELGATILSPVKIMISSKCLSSRDTLGMFLETCVWKFKADL